MTPHEKFLLFVASYLAALGCRRPFDALKNARLIANDMPGLISEAVAEQRAFDFAAWCSYGSPRPDWLPKTIEEANRLCGVV